MPQKKIRSRPQRPWWILSGSLLIGLLALPAAAAVFTVTLTNGAEIDTRYRPAQSPHDEDKILLITEHGNWISLSKSIVQSVESDFEARGFGTVLDTNTVVLGYSINDLPAPGDEGETTAGEQLIDLLRGRQQEPFTVQQFVEPNSAGGIPVGYTNTTTPPIGAAGLTTQPPVVGDDQ